MIPNEFWERFKNENITVNCKTEDEAKDFVKKCYENEISWCDGSRFMTNYDDYNENTCYCCFLTYKYPTNINTSCVNYEYMRLYYCDINYYYYYANYDNDFDSYDDVCTIIPFSEINKSIKEENKMQFSPNGYSYRGQAFRDIEDYAKYILKCAEDDKVKAEKERQDKLKVEKSKRIEELDKAYVEYFETCTEAKEKYLKTMEQFNKDYGYELKEKYPYLDDIFDSIQKVFNL